MYELCLFLLCGFTLRSLARLLTLGLALLLGLTLLHILLLSHYILTVRIENEPCDANYEK
jgi:hypothetical protein